MVNFLDGPAAGIELNIRRAPFLLRVTRNALLGEWDALDQLADEPTDNEEIFVYRLASVPIRGFIDYRDGRGRRGEPFIQADYRYDGVAQPDEQITRGRGYWAWCKDELIRLWPTLSDELHQHIGAAMIRATKALKEELGHA